MILKLGLRPLPRSQSVNQHLRILQVSALHSKYGPSVLLNLEQTRVRRSTPLPLVDLMILLDKHQIISVSKGDVSTIALLIGRVHQSNVILPLQIGEKEVPRVVHELLELDIVENRVDAVQHLKVVEIIGNAEFLLQRICFSCSEVLKY